MRQIMGYKHVFFDLDGTLTDSGEGILKCAKLALHHFGITGYDEKQLRSFVGPPLRESFLRFGVKMEDTDEAIRIFRSRYLTVGKFENFPYPGIHDLLQRLLDGGCSLYVATSKPETTALEVLERFDLTRYFTKICGATMDDARTTKSAVIGYLLGQLEHPERVVMVGDTAFDVAGAAEHHIPTIGVSWGYGEVADMARAGAVSIAHTMDELAAQIL